jgi:hypothetical protein
LVFRQISSKSFLISYHLPEANPSSLLLFLETSFSAAKLSIVPHKLTPLGGFLDISAPAG